MAGLLQALPQIIAMLSGQGGGQPQGAPQQAPPQQVPQGQPAQLQQPGGGGNTNAGPQGVPNLPQGGGAPQQGMVDALMQRAQSMMTNPNSQMVPQPQQGSINPAQHPIIATLLKGLAQGASNYGMTAMAPQERLQRQELENQKAQTLAGLAGTQQYREGELDYRNKMAGTAQQNADTKSDAQDTNAQFKAFQEQNKTAQLEQAKMLGMARIDVQAGRLAQGATKIANQASQFEQNFGLAVKKYGLEAAKNEMMEQGLGIKQQAVDVVRTAMQQRGTQEGTAAIQTLQKMELEHPLLSNIFGFDVSDIMGSSAQPTQVPGTNSAVPTAPAPTAAPSNPTISPKKVNQQTPGGATHIFVPGKGIQPIGQQ